MQIKNSKAGKMIQKSTCQRQFSQSEKYSRKERVGGNIIQNWKNVNKIGTRI